MARKNNSARKKKTSKKKINLDRLLSIGAFFISIFALLISGCQYSLSAQQDNESKTAIWNGTYNKEKQEFSFTSFNSDITLRDAVVYFPNEIYKKNNVFLRPPNYSFSTLLLESSIADFVDNTNSRNSDAQTIKEGNIPIIINSLYYAKGKLYEEVAGYVIDFTYILPADEIAPPIIQINGMMFSHHISKKEIDLQSYLDKIWNEEYKKYLSINHELK